MHTTAYTIGHSTHSIEGFIALLQQYGVTAICDVRSTPYSRVNPQFNREALKKTLYQSGIAYAFLGEELGARSDDPTCYEHGRVRYDRLARTPLFQRGLARLNEGMKKYEIALICAEREPANCHRTILVGRQLVALGVNVAHIQGDGRIESHTELLTRLIRTFRLQEDDMFRSREEIIAEAYRLQEERIAYAPPDGVLLPGGHQKTTRA